MTRRPIFYDTETTGISSERDRIIEIAAYDPVHQATFHSLINPGLLIPPDATAIHGITNEMVANSPNFGRCSADFIKFCEGDTVLIAHNNDGFDMHFLRQEFSRHQIEMPSWHFLDSLKWARRYRPDLPRHTLQFLREIYGIEANTAHRALDDVIILHKLFSLMTDDLPIEQVMQLIQRPRELTHMPFGKYQGKPLNMLPKDYVKWLSGSGAFDKADNKDLKASLEKLGLL